MSRELITVGINDYSGAHLAVAEMKCSRNPTEAFVPVTPGKMEFWKKLSIFELAGLLPVKLFFLLSLCLLSHWLYQEQQNQTFHGYITSVIGVECFIELDNDHLKSSIVDFHFRNVTFQEFTLL